jgi:isopentenyl-diphosphate Delta-isomerase
MAMINLYDMVDIERIIFVDDEGTPTGETGPKLASHSGNTQLHLAFSCYILRRDDNKFLMTQRALSKKVWPGVWTNSVCGHPAPGEKMEDAIIRRAKFELGIDKLENITCLVSKYIYKTPPFKGIVEHEYCPIFVAYVSDVPNPNPDEVEAFEWLDWDDYALLLETEPDRMSYWCKDQYRLLKDIKPFAHL